MLSGIPIGLDHKITIVCNQMSLIVYSVCNSPQSRIHIRGGSFENNVSEPEIKVATWSLSHPVHISEEV